LKPTHRKQASVRRDTDPEVPMHPFFKRVLMAGLVLSTLGHGPAARSQDDPGSAGREAAAEGKSAGVLWVAPEKAVAEAKRLDKPILYDFTAAWCPPCRMLHQELFQDKKAAQYINKNFVPVRVVDRYREDGRNKPVVARLQSKYRLRAFPTLVLVTPDQSREVQSVGYVDRREALAFFEKFLAQKP
jgi:thiol-disulfide isomerase/thioredoxin